MTFAILLSGLVASQNGIVANGTVSVTGTNVLIKGSAEEQFYASGYFWFPLVQKSYPPAGQLPAIVVGLGDLPSGHEWSGSATAGSTTASEFASATAQAATASSGAKLLASHEAKATGNSNTARSDAFAGAASPPTGATTSGNLNITANAPVDMTVTAKFKVTASGNVSPTSYTNNSSNRGTLSATCGGLVDLNGGIWGRNGNLAPPSPKTDWFDEDGVRQRKEFHTYNNGDCVGFNCDIECSCMYLLSPEAGEVDQPLSAGAAFLASRNKYDPAAATNKGNVTVTVTGVTGKLVWP